jgi:hypothetical protein
MKHHLLEARQGLLIHAPDLGDAVEKVLHICGTEALSHREDHELVGVGDLALVP